MREPWRAAFARRGVELCGVCRWDSLPGPLDVRAAARLPERPCSVIACALPYRAEDAGGRNVARYAVPDDYHALAGALLGEVCGELRALYPGAAFAPFADISPVREVEAARLCGLGVVGRHGLLITGRYGSWVFVGEIVTDAALPPSAPARGGCLGCGSCLRACPTGALRESGFDAGRCRSHITQKKGGLTAWEQAQLRAGGLAWGCDICQERCPMNADSEPTPLAAFRENRHPVLRAEDLARLVKRKAYGYRGKAVLRRNLALLDGADGP